MKTAPQRAAIDHVAAWMNLQQANRVVQGRLEERLQEATGLSWGEFELLLRLQVAAQQLLQMGQIADQLLGSPSGVTRMADRLEKNGLIAREIPRENRRVVHVRLTPHGRDVLAQSRDAFEDALGVAFSDHLSEAEVAALRRVLRKLLEGNGAWAVDRCEPGFAKVPRSPKAEPIGGR